MAFYMRNQLRRKKMIEQRLMGIGFILISFFVLAIASTGTTPEDSDCTVIFFTVPVGVALLFSKDQWIM